MSLVDPPRGSRELSLLRPSLHCDHHLPALYWYPLIGAIPKVIALSPECLQWQRSKEKKLNLWTWNEKSSVLGIFCPRRWLRSVSKIFADIPHPRSGIYFILPIPKMPKTENPKLKPLKPHKPMTLHLRSIPFQATTTVE